MGNHIYIIIWIIILSGILGGLINFFLLFTSQNDTKILWWVLLIKSILLGLGASLIVPLFLETISSNIMELSKSDSFPEKRYFVIAGFCLLAAIFSKRFIEDVYTRIMKAEKDSQEAKQIVKEFENSKTEIDDDEETVLSFKTSFTKGFDGDKENVKRVVRAILQSQYSYRTLSGIAKETNLNKEIVANILTTLKANGFAESKQNKQGSYVWKIIIK